MKKNFRKFRVFLTLKWAFFEPQMAHFTHILAPNGALLRALRVMFWGFEVETLRGPFKSDLEQKKIVDFFAIFRPPDPPPLGGPGRGPAGPRTPPGTPKWSKGGQSGLQTMLDRSGPLKNLLREYKYVKNGPV